MFWQFSFWSPTFAGLTGGEAIGVAFNFSGEASASGTCGGTGFCGPTSDARIELRQNGSNVLGTALAVETGPTVAPMNTDQVTGPPVIWDIRLILRSLEGGFASPRGASGNGSSVADVINIQLVVDFALTESLTQAANPGLTQAIIDQGLADLEVWVSPGVDLSAFAPQFPQTPNPPTPVPTLGLPAQIITVLSLVVGCLVFFTRREWPNHSI